MFEIANHFISIAIFENAQVNRSKSDMFTQDYKILVGLEKMLFINEADAEIICLIFMASIFPFYITFQERYEFQSRF